MVHSKAVWQAGEYLIFDFIFISHTIGHSLFVLCSTAPLLQSFFVRLLCLCVECVVCLCTCVLSVFPSYILLHHPVSVALLLFSLCCVAPFLLCCLFAVCCCALSARACVTAALYIVAIYMFSALCAFAALTAALFDALSVCNNTIDAIYFTRHKAVLY